MTTPATDVTSASSAAAVGPPITHEQRGISFHDILSALNPLQYLPVVGTIYRAVTGDVIPEPLRRLGSLLVSGLLGGPIGVAVSLATTAAETITGLDPEKIVAAQFTTATTPAISSAANLTSTPSASARLAMTSAQLAAYGVSEDASGTLRLGDIRGADVLNAIELGRHAKATAAYAASRIDAGRA